MQVHSTVLHQFALGTKDLLSHAEFREHFRLRGALTEQSTVRVSGAGELDILP